MRAVVGTAWSGIDEKGTAVGATREGMVGERTVMGVERNGVAGKVSAAEHRAECAGGPTGPCGSKDA
jgi:hypothetical protein